eukprot:scaffold36096_cov59-Attheya_sp.AAC.3
MAEHESNTQRLSAPPRGLPGFLRRSLRLEDELDSTSSGGESNGDRPSQQLQLGLAPDKTVGKDQATRSSDLKPDGRSLLPPTNNSEVVEESRSVRTASIASDSVATTTTADGKPNDSSADATDDSIGGDRSKSYKEKQFEKVITAPVVNMRELRNLGWNGIPAEHRAQAWKILLGYLPANQSRREQTLMRKRAEYRDAIAQHYDIDDNSRTNQEQETLRQVLVDVPRTAPEVGLFRNDRIRQCLSRLLYIWAMRHPASSYVQGINDLATPLISVFLSGYYDGKDVLNGEILNEVSDQVLVEVEADCYWCLTNLLAGIQDHYTSDQPGVQRMVMRLEELWMNCLLLREFNLKSVFRLWDTYFSEGDGGFEDFHVYVCAAFLCQFSGNVREMEFDQLWGFMQNMPTDDWGDSEIEILLSQA